MGDFDEEIAREKEYAEDRANENTDDQLGGIGDFEEYDESRESKSKKKSPSPSAASSTKQQSSDAAGDASAGGESADSGNSEPVSDSNDPQQLEPGDETDKELDEQADSRKNDDIVARQIREAADQETDPELKKKLWEEYYNYKRQ